MGQYMVFLIVNFIEKVKNLFMWHHYDKTKFFCMILLGILLVLKMLPLRLVFLVGILRSLKKGVHYHKHTQDINKVITIELVRVII